jgi:hypothetical protein
MNDHRYARADGGQFRGHQRAETGFWRKFRDAQFVEMTGQ